MSKGIILHHWDTDGICSCVMLKQELAKEARDMEWTTFTPRIGNYFLNEKEMTLLEKGGFDELVIADMAIPSDQVGRLSGSIGRIRHFDHHYQRPHNLKNVEHVNPVATGKTQDDYPACTIVIIHPGNE